VHPCSNLRSLGSILKRVLATLFGLFGAPRSDSAPGNCAPIVTSLVALFEKISLGDNGCTDFDLILGSQSMVLFGSIPRILSLKNDKSQVVSFLKPIY